MESEVKPGVSLDRVVPVLHQRCKTLETLASGGVPLTYVTTVALPNKLSKVKVQDPWGKLPFLEKPGSARQGRYVVPYLQRLVLAIPICRASLITRLNDIGCVVSMCCLCQDRFSPGAIVRLSS